VLQCSFFVNYKGKPFMEGLFENRPLLYALSAAQVTILVAAAGLMPDLNELLELVTEWPNSAFRNLLVGVLVADFVAAHVAEVR
jgi:cation-transporting ATPase 13A1